MVNIFLKVLSMSLTASYCVILICAVRLLLLKKCPKIFSYLLWGIVAIRLVCPIGVEGRFSLIGAPVRELSKFLAGDAWEHPAWYPEVFLKGVFTDKQSNFAGYTYDDNYTYDNYAYGDYHGNAQNDDAQNDMNHSDIDYYGMDKSGMDYHAVANYGMDYYDMDYHNMEYHDMVNHGMEYPHTDSRLALPASLIHAMAYIWLAVAFGLLAYNLISYWQIRKKLKRKAVYEDMYGESPIYTVEGLETPFVLGIQKTAIYLPQSLTGQERKYCLAHEYIHICRKDYLIKQCAFFLVCIYWFNALMWLAFYCMTKDMEMSCDESALKCASLQERKAYSKALLHLSLEKQTVSGYSSFSRDNVSSRIRNILNFGNESIFKKTLSIALIIICTAGMLTDPVSQYIPHLKSTVYAATNDKNTAKYMINSTALNIQQAKESAVTADIRNRIGDRNLYAAIVLPNQDDNNIAGAIQVKAQPMDSSDEIVGSLHPGDRVQVLSIGCSIAGDGMAYGDFQKTDPFTVEYAMILFDASKEGEQKRGYVKTDNLSLDVPENTLDTYVYWTAKAWCDYFCTKNYGLMARLAADEEQCCHNITNSALFAPIDNPRIFPWKGYYIFVPSQMPSSIADSEKDEAEVNLYYFEESAKPDMIVWRQDLTIQLDKLKEVRSIDELLYGGTVDDSEPRRCEKISSYEEFKDVYLAKDGTYCFTYFDYENEIFKFHASIRSDMTFREPEFALRHYLHLEKDIEIEEAEDAQSRKNVGGNEDDADSGELHTVMKCTFPEDVSVIFPMCKKDGLWYIISTYPWQETAEWP